MVQNLGNSTFLFEGSARRGNCSSPVDHIAVNGLCVDDRDPWQSLDQRFWLEEWLLEPQARVLLVSNRLNAHSSLDDLLREGENLLRAIERFRAAPNIPLIFHCVGLGGIIFLKALQISETRDAGRRLASTTAGVVFYGSPISPQQNIADIRRSIRQCFTTELHLERLHEITVSDQSASRIQDLLKLPNICKFEIVSIYEQIDSVWKAQRAIGASTKRKIVVPQTLASIETSRCIGLERDHRSIAKLDWQSYTSISQEIKGIITRFRNANKLPTVIGGANVAVEEFIASSSFSGLELTPDSSSSTDLDSPSIYSAHPPARQTPSRTVGLPVHKIDFPQNKDFVGRKDVLAEIERELFEDKDVKNSTHAFAIHGTAGVGKTQTALEFAYQNKDKLPAILWASAETRYKLVQSFSEYSVLLGLVEGSVKHDANADVLLEWYKTTDTPWLIVMDNAVDRSVILDFWPRNRVGTILITTQVPAFAGPDIANKGRELLQLDEDSAILLLQNSLNQSATFVDEDARTLIKRVGCLPVALRTCIGQINEADCSLEEYNRDWNSARTIIKDADVRYLETLNARYPKSLQNLWAVSFQNLNSDARAMINVFSLLDDEHIPEVLFKNEALYNQLPFLKARVRAIRDLSQSSLIGKEISTDTGTASQIGKRFHIHRMTRTFAQMQMDGSAEQAAFDAAALLLDASVVHEKLGTRWLNGGDYFQHVQALHDYYESTLRGETENGPLTVSIAFITLLRKTSWWCYRNGFFEPGLQFIATINNTHDKPDTHPFAGDWKRLEVEVVWNHYQHGSLITELGDWQLAYDYFDLALKSRRKAVEKGYEGLPREFVMHGGLANGCNGLGRHIEAERHYQTALDLQPEDAIWDVYEASICLSLSVQGPHRYEEAARRCEAFVKRREEFYGKDDTVDFILGHCFYIYGNLRKLQAKEPSLTAEQRQQFLDDSYNLHTRSLKNWKITHGEPHHHTADAICRVAWHMAERGNNTTAINLYQQALSRYKHPINRKFRQREIARATFMLSLAFKNDGQLEKAEQCRIEAERARKEILKEKFEPATGLESYDRLVSLWQL